MKYSIVITPNLSTRTWTAAVQSGNSVQLLGERFPSYETAKASAEHLIEAKRRNDTNRGFERLLDKVAPPADPVDQRAREDAEGARMGGDRWDGQQ